MPANSNQEMSCLAGIIEQICGGAVSSTTPPYPPKAKIGANSIYATHNNTKIVGKEDEPVLSSSTASSRSGTKDEREKHTRKENATHHQEILPGQSPLSIVAPENSLERPRTVTGPAQILQEGEEEV